MNAPDGNRPSPSSLCLDRSQFGKPTADCAQPRVRRVCGRSYPRPTPEPATGQPSRAANPRLVAADMTGASTHFSVIRPLCWGHAHEHCLGESPRLKCRRVRPRERWVPGCIKSLFAGLAARNPCRLAGQPQRGISDKFRHRHWKRAQPVGQRPGHLRKKYNLAVASLARPRLPGLAEVLLV